VCEQFANRKSGRRDYPAIEYQRIPDLVDPAGHGHCVEEPGAQLLIIAKKPIEQVKSLALDASSRSTQTLTRILCAESGRLRRSSLKHRRTWAPCCSKPMRRS